MYSSFSSIKLAILHSAEALVDAAPVAEEQLTKGMSEVAVKSSVDQRVQKVVNVTCVISGQNNRICDGTNEK